MVLQSCREELLVLSGPQGILWEPLLHTDFQKLLRGVLLKQRVVRYGSSGALERHGGRNSDTPTSRLTARQEGSTGSQEHDKTPAKSLPETLKAKIWTKKLNS